VISAQDVRTHRFDQLGFPFRFFEGRITSHTAECPVGYIIKSMVSQNDVPFHFNWNINSFWTLRYSLMNCSKIIGFVASENS
jgi:hypothetical protein